MKTTVESHSRELLSTPPDARGLDRIAFAVEAYRTLAKEMAGAEMVSVEEFRAFVSSVADAFEALGAELKAEGEMTPPAARTTEGGE